MLRDINHTDFVKSGLDKSKNKANASLVFPLNQILDQIHKRREEKEEGGKVIATWLRYKQRSVLTTNVIATLQRH